MRASLRSGLLLSIASLAGCFLALEIGIRAVDAWRGNHQVKWAVYDEEIGYRLNPDWLDINNQGLRDHPIGAKGENPRLLVLGDSVAFNGETIDDTWVAHLRRELRVAGDPTEVVNAAVRGYTTHQELLYLERDGLAFEPDLVGLGFVLNDLHDFLTRFRVEKGEIVGTDYDFTEEALNGVENRLYRLLRRSRLLVFIRQESAFLLDRVLDLAAGETYTFDGRPDFLTAWQDEPWSKVERQLGRLVVLGKEHGFEAFVQVTPFAEQYRNDYLLRDRDYVLKPQRKLAEICDRLGLPLLDLYPILAASHFEDDGIHLSPEGRRLVGKETARFLLRQGLLPSSPP